MPENRPAATTSTGFGRVLVAVYAILALAATARGLYQVIVKFGDAPIAYTLSAVAGVVYLLATYALATNRHTLAFATISFELLGVLGVGLFTLFDAGDFPDQTVWSGFGQGYGYIPLVLPFVGLWWVRRTARS